MPPSIQGTQTQTPSPQMRFRGSYCRINHHLGEDRMLTFLAFENCASHDAILDDGRRTSRMQQESDLDFADHSHGKRFERSSDR